MPLSCYECNGQTKIKLEDLKQNKQSFNACLAGLTDEK